MTIWHVRLNVSGFLVGDRIKNQIRQKMNLTKTLLLTCKVLENFIKTCSRYPILERKIYLECSD